MVQEAHPTVEMYWTEGEEYLVDEHRDEVVRTIRKNLHADSRMNPGKVVEVD